MTAQIDVYCNKDEGGHVCSVHVSVIYDFAWHDTTKLMCFERVGKGVPVCSLWNTWIGWYSRGSSKEQGSTTCVGTLLFCGSLLLLLVAGVGNSLLFEDNSESLVMTPICEMIILLSPTISTDLATADAMSSEGVISCLPRGRIVVAKSMPRVSLSRVDSISC